MVLTDMEKLVINNVGDSEYNNGVPENGTWLFEATRRLEGFSSKQLRGALSSVIKKGLVTISKHKTYNATPGDEDTINFTDKGLSLYLSYNGE